MKPSEFAESLAQKVSIKRVCTARMKEVFEDMRKGVYDKIDPTPVISEPADLGLEVPKPKVKQPLKTTSGKAGVK